MAGAQLAGPVFENTGELFLVLVAGAVLLVGGLILTVLGIVRASVRGDIVWLVGIIAAFFFGFSWLVALIYLLMVRSSTVRQVGEIRPDPLYRCMSCGRPAPLGANFCMTCGGQVRVQERRPFR